MDGVSIMKLIHCVIISESVLSPFHSDIMEGQVCILFSSEGPADCKGSINVDQRKDLTRANLRIECNSAKFYIKRLQTFLIKNFTF